MTDTRKRAEEWLKEPSQHYLYCQALKAGRCDCGEEIKRSFVRNLLTESDQQDARIAALEQKVTLLEGLLAAEQEDCQRQRTNKNAEWERATALEEENKRLREALQSIIPDAKEMLETKRDWLDEGYTVSVDGCVDTEDRITSAERALLPSEEVKP